MQPARRAITLPRALALGLIATVLAAPGVARASAQRPELAAKEAILVEADTGATIFSYHANREVAIASTTKLMTAYVTLESDPLARDVLEHAYYPETANQSLAGLPPGYRYSVADMLRAMLLPSGNDVAHSLGLDVGGSTPHFVDLMNAAARKLGLDHTHYSTPIGLDTAGNYSSAADLETLAYALMRDPFFAAVVRERYAYLPHGDEVDNTNDLLAYPFVSGIKTGHTLDAGYCLVGAASWHGVHLISVVLGDPDEADRDADTLALLRYGLHLYHRVHVAVKGRAYYRASTNGTRKSVALVAAHAAKLVVRRSSGLHVDLDDVSRDIDGPVAAGTQAGRIEASDDGRVVATISLVTKAAVRDPPSSSPLRSIVEIAALVVAAGCTLRLMRRRATGAFRPRARR